MVFGRLGESVRRYFEANKAKESVSNAAAEAPTREPFAQNPDGIPVGAELPAAETAEAPSEFGYKTTGTDVPESQLMPPAFEPDALTPDELTEKERLEVAGIRQELNGLPDTAEPIDQPAAAK